MESVGKRAVTSASGPRRLVPSIVEPLELSERSDSSFLIRRKSYAPDLAPAKHGSEGLLVDKQLIDEAVTWIRGRIAVTLSRGAQEVGDYVLDKFFNGDPVLAMSKNPHKNASFRALAERCGTQELPVAKTWLNNAVGVAVGHRRIEAVF